MRELFDTSFILVTDDERERFTTQYLEWVRKGIGDNVAPYYGKYIIFNPHHSDASQSNQSNFVVGDSLNELIKEARQKGLKQLYIVKIPRPRQ